MPDPGKLIAEDEMVTELASKLAESVDAFGSQMLEQIANSYGDPDALPDAFDVSNPEVKAFLEASAGELADIDDTTRDYLRDYVAKAYEDGKSIDDMVADMESDTNLAFGEARSELIARTEVLGASNFGTLSGLKQSGVIDKKVWLATPGTKGSRDGSDGQADHEALGAMDPIGINEKWIEPEFGDELDHPGDGPPRQCCNCRCALSGWVDDPEGFDEGKSVAKAAKGRALHTSHAEIEKLRAPHERAIREAAAKVLGKQRAAVVAALRKAKR